MRTLAELTPEFARLDGVEGDLAAYEKALRNLVQRNHLPPTDQAGRVFLYDLPEAAAIRIAQIANDFGLSRAAIDPICRWMRDAYRGTFPPKPGLQPSNMSEAVRRVREGEAFAVTLTMDARRRYLVKPDWERPHRRKAPQEYPEIGGFAVPASQIIADLLPLFED